MNFKYFITRFSYQKSIFQKAKVGSEESNKLNKLRNLNNLMKDKLESQKKNIENNTPRVGVALFSLLAIPSFYYLYESFRQPYHHEEFYQQVRKSIDWMNMKYAFCSGIMFGLEMLKFKDFKATNSLKRYGSVYILTMIPVLFSMCSLSSYESTYKGWTMFTMINMIGSLALMAKVVNETMLPFWCFSLIYYVYFLDFFIITINYFMLKNLSAQIKNNPSRFIQ